MDDDRPLTNRKLEFRIRRLAREGCAFADSLSAGQRFVERRAFARVDREWRKHVQDPPG